MPADDYSDKNESSRVLLVFLCEFKLLLVLYAIQPQMAWETMLLQQYKQL